MTKTKCTKCGFFVACPECSIKYDNAEKQGYKQMARERKAKKISAWQCTWCKEIYTNKEEAKECCDDK